MKPEAGKKTLHSENDCMHLNVCARKCVPVARLPWFFLHVLQELCGCVYSETCSNIRWLQSPDLEQLQCVCVRVCAYSGPLHLPK